MAADSRASVLQQLAHHASEALGDYAIRTSLGLIASLLLAIGATRVPVYESSPWVGWAHHPDADRIALQELAEDVPDEPEADRVPALADAPPVTVQPPQIDAPVHDQTPAFQTPLKAPEQPASESDLLTATQLAAIGPAGQAPEVVGGQGSLYLRIHYPEEARRQGIQGLVILDFIVDRNGYTQDIRVIKSLHPLCDSSAVQALQETRFVPGRRNGERIAVRMRLPIRFRLIGLNLNAPTPTTASSQDASPQ